MSTENAVEIGKCFDDWIAESSDRSLVDSFHYFANDTITETPSDSIRTPEPWTSRQGKEPFIVEDNGPLSVNVDRTRHREIKARRKKLPKSLPKRPLSAYNFFFQQLRNTLMHENTPLGFQDLAKMVGQHWKTLPKSERERYNVLADEDYERYQREMKEYKERENDKRKEDSLLDYQPEDINNNETPYMTASNNHAKLYRTDPVHPLYLYPEQPKLTFSPHFHYPPYAPPYAGTYYAPYGPHAAPPHSGLQPLPPGVMFGPVPSSGFPLIPQQEVLVPTPSGHLKKYKIQYAVMTMTEAAAKEYMQQWHNMEGPPPAGPGMDGGNAAVPRSRSDLGRKRGWGESFR